MLKHKITFAKCIKEDIESSEFILRAEAQLPNDHEIIKTIKKLCKSHTKTVKCYVKENVLHINIKTLAKCSQYDVPDKIKGKRIAESKAKYNLYRVLNTIAGIIYFCYTFKCVSYKDSRNRYLNLAKKESAHIKELDTL